jgi:hypothetical protein
MSSAVGPLPQASIGKIAGQANPVNFRRALGINDGMRTCIASCPIIQSLSAVTIHLIAHQLRAGARVHEATRLMATALAHAKLGEGLAAFFTAAQVGRNINLPAEAKYAPRTELLKKNLDSKGAANFI